MNLSDVLEYQLLIGFHHEVLAKLTAPAKEVGGQEDGRGQMAGYPVGLLHVGLDLLVLQEVESQAGELKYQSINTFHHVRFRI